jgi:transposase
MEALAAAQDGAVQMIDASVVRMEPVSRATENNTWAGREAGFERFFNKIKQCRLFATRYDKLAANYLAFVKVAGIRIWLRAYESTP